MVLLYFLGGLINFFVFFYLLVLVVGVVMLVWFYVLLLVLCVLGCYLGLVYFYQLLYIYDYGQVMVYYLVGMWINFLILVLFIIWFVSCIVVVVCLCDGQLVQVCECQLQSYCIVVFGIQVVGVVYVFNILLFMVVVIVGEMCCDMVGNFVLVVYEEDVWVVEEQIIVCKVVLENMWFDVDVQLCNEDSVFIMFWFISLLEGWWLCYLVVLLVVEVYQLGWKVSQL